MPSTVSRRPTPAATFALLSVSAGSFAMLQSLISPVLPTVEQALHTTHAGVSWVLIAWLLSASVATPILGRISDMIGKDRTLLVVLGAIALGSLVSALAPGIGVMVAGRVIQGLGGAVYPVAFGIIRDEFEARRVPSAIGTMSSVIAVGGGIGTVLAGPITAELGWRWLFWIPLIVVVVVGVLSLLLMPRSPVRSGGRINRAASTLLAIWLIALLLPVSQGQTWGWGSFPTIGLFVVAAVALTAWIMVESRSTNPVIDMGMMRQRAVWTTNLVALLFGASMFSVLTFLPQFIETPRAAGYGFGSSVTVAGLIILPMLITMALGGMISGPIHHSVGFKAQLAWGSALLGAGSLGFALWNAAPWQVALGAAAFGLGLGLAYSAMTSVIVQSVAPARTGVATGMNTNIRNIGGAIGTAVVTAIVTTAPGRAGFPAARGYTDGFALLALTAAVAVILALLVPTTPHTGTANSADAPPPEPADATASTAQPTGGQ